eukprot:11538867-Heterocapsa_arctica.AAC.1
MEVRESPVPEGRQGRGRRRETPVRGLRCCGTQPYAAGGVRRTGPAVLGNQLRFVRARDACERAPHRRWRRLGCDTPRGRGSCDRTL